jgi:hypothetical protein
MGGAGNRKVEENNMRNPLIETSSEFRKTRDAMFARDIPPGVRAMTTEELVSAMKAEPFIDPFKYLELKNRGINP